MLLKSSTKKCLCSCLHWEDFFINKKSTWLEVLFPSAFAIFSHLLASTSSGGNKISSFSNFSWKIRIFDWGQSYSSIEINIFLKKQVHVHNKHTLWETRRTSWHVSFLYPSSHCHRKYLSLNPQCKRQRNLNECIFSIFIGKDLSVGMISLIPAV